MWLCQLFYRTTLVLSFHDESDHKVDWSEGYPPFLNIEIEHKSEVRRNANAGEAATDSEVLRKEAVLAGGGRGQGGGE